MLPTLKLRACSITALLVNFLAAILLTCGFSATSSSFRLLKTEGAGVTTYQICVEALTLAKADTRGNLVQNMTQCRDWEKAKPAAIVVAEHPAMLRWGLMLLILGFFMQLLMQVLDVPTPKNTFNAGPAAH